MTTEAEANTDALMVNWRINRQGRFFLRLVEAGMRAVADTDLEKSDAEGRADLVDQVIFLAQALSSKAFHVLESNEEAMWVPGEDD